MTPSQNKHDPYTNMVSYESTPSGDHNMSICRQAKKMYIARVFAMIGAESEFLPQGLFVQQIIPHRKKKWKLL